MALHMGNDSNMARLHSGYRDLSPQTREKLLGLLSKEDWGAVQGIWDTYESMWDRLDAQHYNINGFHMQKIEARGFTREGNAYRGGYAPALYDTAMNRFMREKAEADSLFASTEAAYQSPAAKSGMTKARSEQAPGIPLLLSMDTIGKHLNDAATYISMAEHVRFVDRVTRSAAYEDAITHALGKDVYDAIRPNLNGYLAT